MRRKIITVVAATTLGLSGIALAGPALAAVGADGAAAAVDSRVDRVREALAGLVGDGTLTQEQADRVATTLSSADRGPFGPGGPGGPGRFGGPGGPFGPGVPLDAAADALGLTDEELRTALRDGSTLAGVAEREGVPVQTVVDALVAVEQERLAEAVADGRLTQEQADERLATLADRITERVESGPPAGHRGGQGPEDAHESAPEDDAGEAAPSSLGTA